VAAQGLSAALWGQAVIMLALAGVALLLPRRLEAAGVEPPAAHGLRETLGRLLARRETLAVATVAAVIMSANVLLSTISGQFWVERLRWSVEDLTTTLAPLLLVVNLAAYAVTTVAVDRLGHVRSAVLGSAGLGLSWVGFGLLAGLWGSTPFVLGFVVVEGLATAALYVGLHAALMDATVPALRATHFAVLMALLNLPRAVVAPLAPTVLDALGYAGLFVAAGVFQVVMAAVLRRVGSRAPAP
jgi:hypothetical protein